MTDRISNCANCDFWLVMETQPGWGQCRRRAPVVVSTTYLDGLERVQSEAQSVFPMTQGSDWCGEHVVREQRG